MPPLVDALASWRNFYELLGAASATMIGLLFVAATVGSGIFSSDQRAAYASPSALYAGHSDVEIPDCAPALGYQNR